MAEVKSSLFRTSARELKPATCKIWINFIYIKSTTIMIKRKTTSLVHFTMIEMMIKMMTKMIKMIKMMIEPTSLVHFTMIEMMVKMMTKMMMTTMTKMIKMTIEPTSLVHLMMIGQNGCKEGREWCRSNLVRSIIIRRQRTIII